MNDIPLLYCYQVSKYYQEGKLYTHVLRNVSFTIQRGEMIAIVGSSGSGKSTLLHLLGTLDEPTGGQIIFEGKPINMLSLASRSLFRNQKLGFIYQFHHLLSDFTAIENVSMPLLISGTSSNYAKEQAKNMLALVGLQKHGYHRPAELSGGERQRVAIARALINKPALVLADEPTGNLDQHNADSILKLLMKINMQQKTTFVVVTHDMELAKRLHRKIELRNGILL